jgi:hypothetical protein
MYCAARQPQLQAVQYICLQIRLKKQVSMKINILVFSLLTFFSNSNAEKNNTTNQQGATKPSTVSEVLVIFKPGTVYHTPAWDMDYNMQRKVYNAAWEEKGYSVLFNQGLPLDSFNHQQFELVDVFGQRNHIILFNQTVEEKDSIKHIILDTLYNFDSFTDTLKDIGTLAGVLHKDELMGINTLTIDTRAIVAVTQTGS